MLVGLKGSAREDVCDKVVRALGLAGRWDEAEEFARGENARSLFAPPLLAWARARENAFARAEALVTWAKPPNEEPNAASGGGRSSRRRALARTLSLSTASRFDVLGAKRHEMARDAAA